MQNSLEGLWKQKVNKVNVSESISEDCSEGAKEAKGDDNNEDRHLLVEVKETKSNENSVVPSITVHSVDHLKKCADFLDENRSCLRDLNEQEIAGAVNFLVEIVRAVKVFKSKREVSQDHLKLFQASCREFTQAIIQRDAQKDELDSQKDELDAREDAIKKLAEFFCVEVTPPNEDQDKQEDQVKTVRKHQLRRMSTTLEKLTSVVTKITRTNGTREVIKLDAKNDVFTASLAKRCGLSVPETVRLSEHDKAYLTKKRIEFDDGHSAKMTVVGGKTFDELALGEGWGIKEYKLKKIVVEELGKSLAFQLFIRGHDRWPMSSDIFGQANGQWNFGNIMLEGDCVVLIDTDLQDPLVNEGEISNYIAHVRRLLLDALLREDGGELIQDAMSALENKCHLQFEEPTNLVIQSFQEGIREFLTSLKSLNILRCVENDSFQKHVSFLKMCKEGLNDVLYRETVLKEIGKASGAVAKRWGGKSLTLFNNQNRRMPTHAYEIYIAAYDGALDDKLDDLGRFMSKVNTSCFPCAIFGSRNNETRTLYEKLLDNFNTDVPRVVI